MGKAVIGKNSFQTCPKLHQNQMSLRVGGISVALQLIYSEFCNALVDDRLAGEGTGKVLGINTPILGWIITGVFATIWAAYFASTNELGGQNEEDDLGL